MFGFRVSGLRATFLYLFVWQKGLKKKGGITPHGPCRGERFQYSGAGRRDSAGFLPSGLGLGFRVLGFGFRA